MNNNHSVSGFCADAAIKLVPKFDARSTDGQLDRTLQRSK